MALRWRDTSLVIKTLANYLWPRTGEARMSTGCKCGEIGGTAQCGKPPRKQSEVSGGMRGDW